MKAIYKFDNNNYFTVSDLIADDEQLPVNSTEIKPEDGLLDPIKYDASNDTWLGATQEEHDEFHKNDPVEPDLPNDTDALKAMIGNLVTDNAKKSQTISQLQTMMGSVVTDLAQLKGGN